MNIRRLVIATAFFAAGCAAQGPSYERAYAPPNNAIIYVYRPYSFFGSLMRPEVRCGTESAIIRPGGYHAFVVPAGEKVVCHVHTETADEVDIDAEPRVYYIREQINMGLLVGRPQLNPMDTDEAQAEIQSCCVEEEPRNKSPEAPLSQP
ncbi:MAG: hypothetical protein ACLQAT_08955 [Candidatus Binataceae bacterium]